MYNVLVRLNLYVLSLQYDSHRTRHGFVSVGDLEHCIHYRVVQHGKMKFLVIGTKTSVEVYAWATKPYSKFMAFKVSVCVCGR